MAKYSSFFLALLVFTLSLEESQAVGVAYKGYFRTRGNFHYNLDLDRSKNPEIRGYTDFRFRLDPSFLITDKVRIHTSWNLIDAVLGGDAFRGVAHSNPALRKDSLLGSEDASEIGRAIPSDQKSSWVYGGAYAPDAAVRTTDLRPIQLRRAWAEVETPYGVFKAGRMPFDFGLGIYGNAGDEIDQEIGSTRDRISFETAFGPYYLEPGVSWFYEGSLDHPQDDAFEYFFLLGRKVESNHVALYLGYYAQDEALDVATNGDLVTENSSYWVVDLYVEQLISNFKLQLEGVLYAGTFLGRDLFAINAAARGTWQKQAFSLLGEAGFSSGTSEDNIKENKIRTYAFNRDYNISYLIFEEALPGGKSLPGETELETRSTSPHSGAISNAVYGRFKLGYKVTDFFHPYLNVVVPVALQDAPKAGGHFYGVEYDVITLWPFQRYLAGELTFAHFIPGSFYNDVSKKHHTFLIRAGMNLIF